MEKAVIVRTGRATAAKTWNTVIRSGLGALSARFRDEKLCFLMLCDVVFTTYFAFFAPDDILFRFEKITGCMLMI